MSSDVQFYLAKVAPEHALKPNYMALLQGLLQPLCDGIALLEAMPGYFDLDQAVGVQLDVCGAWIGRSRQLPIPLQPCFFTFGDPIRGWGKGIWRDANNPGVTLTILNDDTYRRLLQAVAIANEWDGTVAGAAPVLAAFFPPGSGTYAFLEDRTWAVQGGDQTQMQAVIGISGTIPSVVDLEIVAQGLLGIKPGTVDLAYAVTSVNGAPVFGFGVNNEYIGGFGSGAWAVTPDFILAADAALLNPG